MALAPVDEAEERDHATVREPQRGPCFVGAERQGASLHEMWDDADAIDGDDAAEPLDLDL